jgi:hypothetical protein
VLNVRLLILAVSILASTEPALSQEREWSLDASEQDAFLVFGVPQTDDVGLSFWCKIGSGSVAMFYPVTWRDFPENSMVTVRAEFDSAQMTFKGKASARSNGAPASLEVPLKPDAKLFKSMKTSDHFVLKVRGHSAAYPLSGADVDGLLSLCRLSRPEEQPTAD